MDYVAYMRRLDYLNESMNFHSEHSSYVDDCERCQNIKAYATKIIDDMPKFIRVIVTIYMFIRHPIDMYHAKGSLHNLNK